MAGRFDLAGVGPGDPELMTLKAVKIIRNCQVLVLPAESKEKCVAYQIVRRAIPEIEEKRGKKRHLQKNVWHIGLRVRQSRRRKRSCGCIFPCQ